MRVFLARAEDERKSYLLRDLGSGDFSLVTKLDIAPSEDGQQAGIVVWQDENTWLSLARAYCDSLLCEGEGIYFDSLSGGRPSISNPAIGYSGIAEIFLRLEREGSTYRGYFSEDGLEWTLVGQRTWEADPRSAGLMIGFAEESKFVDFDQFAAAPGP